METARHSGGLENAKVRGKGFEVPERSGTREEWRIGEHTATKIADVGNGKESIKLLDGTRRAFFGDFGKVMAEIPRRRQTVI